MILVLVLAVILVAGGLFVRMDNATNAPDPKKSREYQELARQTATALDKIDAIKQLALDYRDVNPVFSDVIIAQIERHDDTKEING